MIETTQIKRNFRQIFEYGKKNWFSWWTKVKGKKFSWQTKCYITFVSTLFSHFSIIFLDDSRTPCLLFWNYRSIIASNDKWCDQRVTSMGQGKYLRAESNWTYDLPYTARILWALSHKRTRGELGHILGSCMTCVLRKTDVCVCDI